MPSSIGKAFDSIIFDLDGTLWDATPHVTFAWQQAKKEVNYIKEEITIQSLRSVTGIPYDRAYEILFPNITTEQRDNFKSLCAKMEIETLNELGGVMYPNLNETIQYLAKHYKLFIVSNCQNGYIDIFFKHYLGSKYFSGHQCYGTKGLLKFENIKDIINEHNLFSPVYIGDTMGDYDAATKAGIPFIFAAYGFGTVDKDPLASINTLKELQEIL